MKGFRFYAEPGTVADPDTLAHYMMVGLYPYDEAGTYNTDLARLIELTVFKNSWETELSSVLTKEPINEPATDVTDAN